MERFLCAICYLVSTAVYAQQAPKVNDFRVLDAVSNKAIPYATVSILKAKLAIATEANGVFHIPGNLAAMRDTISFDVQNYVSLKLPLNKLATMSDILLTRTIFTARHAPDRLSEKFVLNDHPAQDINVYAGVASEDAPFNYMQIAQRFTLAKSGGLLSNIVVNKSTDWMATKFRIRIYDLDPATGGPGADLCDKIIDIDNSRDVNMSMQSSYWDYVPESAVINMDLKKYNVIIPGKNFFVAIEYLRDFLNAVKAPVYNKATKKTDTAIVFRPYIGISPNTGSKLNIWVMELNRSWKLYNHFMPFGTDLAIKATVEY